MAVFSRQRKITNFLINSSYQLRYVGIMLALSALLLVALGGFWYHELREKSNIIGLMVHPGFAADQTSALERMLHAEDLHRLAVLVGLSLAFMFVLGAYSTVLTHKVAGPLHYMSQTLRDLSAGRFRRLRSLRRLDQLKDFYEIYRGAYESLRAQATQDVDLIGRHIALLETHLARLDVQEPGNAELRESLASLRELRRQKMEGLEMEEPPGPTATA
jgi:hypothetical protein